LEPLELIVSLALTVVLWIVRRIGT